MVFDAVQMKPIRRRVLIREMDYRRMITNAYGGVIYDGMMLYNRSEFEPLTKTRIEQEEAWAVLSDKRHVWQYASRGINHIFTGMKDYLYIHAMKCGPSHGIQMAISVCRLESILHAVEWVGPLLNTYLIYD